MDKITEANFETVRKWVTLMAQPNDGWGPIYEAKKKAWETAKPTAAFLIKFYFTTVNPKADDGSRSLTAQGERPYNTTVTERALMRLNGGWPFDGELGSAFLNKYPTLLEESIVFYKKGLADDLNKALNTKLPEMTGAQLLLILKEHDRQRTEGYTLGTTDATGSGEKPRIAAAPHQLLADAERISSQQIKERLNELSGGEDNTKVVA